MRKIVFIIAATLTQYSAFSQVTKNVIVEHFTNTYCSICASRNPGFYTNRVQFPQVIHIAYHPSAPYAACPLNQHNKQENDDRTNYYSIYGATPRLVIQGKVVASSTNYNNASIFQSELGQNSAFEIEAKLTPSGSSSITVSVKLKKVSSSSLSSLQLYAALTEDTLFFNAANGETKHYDVFRKSVWGAPMNITAPSNIGDSIVYTQTIALNSAWIANRMNVVAMLQDANKEIVQVTKSANLKGMTGIGKTNQPTDGIIYPNPTNSVITVEVKEPSVISVYNAIGKLMKTIKQHSLSATYNIDFLPAGVYSIRIADRAGVYYKTIVKE
ncbi:MAG: T9SS type A sorting domain-containing protein [Chitinophagales bacterium]|nr:T9SS type A sorting domain-containing protein [Chitinophagales bacterium]